MNGGRHPTLIFITHQLLVFSKFSSIASETQQFQHMKILELCVFYSFYSSTQYLICICKNICTKHIGEEAGTQECFKIGFEFRMGFISLSNCKPSVFLDIQQVSAGRQEEKGKCTHLSTRVRGKVGLGTAALSFHWTSPSFCKTSQQNTIIGFNISSFLNQGN